MAKEKYSAIYGALKKTILNHGYDRTKMLPSEAHLIEEFQCSRNTVRRAIQQLNQEGLSRVSTERAWWFWSRFLMRTNTPFPSTILWE